MKKENRMFLWAAGGALLAGAGAAGALMATRRKIICLDRPEVRTDGFVRIESPGFREGQPIPDKYAFEGKNLSPALKWANGPVGTQSYAVICEDPDAHMMTQPYVHWLVYNIPSTATVLPEGIPTREWLDKPAGALQGRSSLRELGYTGPNPPEGDPEHHYHFQVFALDTMLPLRPGADRSDLLRAIKGHVLAKGETVGTYIRPEV